MSVAKFAGVVYIAEINPVTGKPKTGFKDVGEVDALEFGFNTSRIEKFSKRDCGNNLVGSVITQVDTNFSVTMAEPTKLNLEKILQGVSAAVSSGTVTDEPLHEGTVVVAGDLLFTKKPFSALTNVKDSAGSPATLVADSDYEVVDGDKGIIRILDPTGFTQPFKATYANKAYTPVPMLNRTPGFYQVAFAGANCQTNEKVRIDLWKVQFNPVSQFNVLSDQFAAFQLGGKLYSDATKTDDAAYSELGNYGRIYVL